MDATLVSAIISALVAFVVAWISNRVINRSTDKQIEQLREQLATTRRQLDVESVGMSSHELVAIDELLVQYPRFRPCFYDGIEPDEIVGITDEDKEIVKAIAGRLVNGYATILLQTTKIGSHRFDTPWANATVARRYGNSSPCCDHLMTYIVEYPVTGYHQFKLMLRGLNEALQVAQLHNDQKKVERLKARIAEAEKSRESIIKKIEEVEATYGVT